MNPLQCLTIGGAEGAAMRLWNDAQFMAKLRLLDDPIKESRHVQGDPSPGEHLSKYLIVATQYPIITVL